MSNRRRYKDVERVLTQILLGEVVVFILYLIFAAFGLSVLKVLIAIVTLLLSGLSLAYLYKIGELKKARSRWLVMGFGSIILCTLVSLILNYPSPAPVPVITPVG